MFLKPQLLHLLAQQHSRGYWDKVGMPSFPLLFAFKKGIKKRGSSARSLLNKLCVLWFPLSPSDTVPHSIMEPPHALGMLLHPQWLPREDSQVLVSCELTPHLHWWQKSHVQKVGLLGFFVCFSCLTAKTRVWFWCKQRIWTVIFYHLREKTTRPSINMPLKKENKVAHVICSGLFTVRSINNRSSPLSIKANMLNHKYGELKSWQIPFCQLSSPML